MASGAVIGIDRLVMWPVTADTSSGITYGDTATAFTKKLMTKQDTPTVNTANLDACNQTVDDYVAINGGELTIGITDLDGTERTLLYGETANVSGVNVSNGDDRPGDLCVAFMTTRSDGKVNLFKYSKTKFSPQAESAETTKKNGITYQTISLKGEYKPSIYDKNARYVQYGVDPVTDAAVVTAWFASAEGTIVPDALAMSSIVPASGAIGITASANVVLTFNNKIASHFITLVDDTTDAIVPAAITADTTGKIITISPTSNMLSGKQAVAIFGVTDVYGQTLTNALSYFTVS